jgi:hypothetical protein
MTARNSLLTSGQLRSLRDALLSAVTDYDALRKLVEEGSWQGEKAWRMEWITLPGKSFKMALFDLIRWADGQGEINRLVQNALKQAPHHQALRDLDEQLRATVPRQGVSPPPAPEPAKEAAPDDGFGRFPSLTAMRSEHLRLLGLARKGAPGWRRQAESLLERGRTTGALLDASADRASAQSLLDYWTATLYTNPEEDRRGSGFESVSPKPSATVPPALLAEYDQSLAPNLPEERRPYPGLVAFGEGDRERFFGREEIVRLMLERLKSKRLLVVLGPSGCGKSSLVLAGLLPALRAGGVPPESGEPGSAVWNFLGPVVPGTDPLATLAGVVRPRDADPADWAAACRMEFRTKPNRLSQLVESRGPAPAFLLVDQAEELFTLCADAADRQAFLDNVLALATPGTAAPHRVVLTLRADYLAQAAATPGLKALADDEQVRLVPPALTARELRQVIEEPARRIGLKFEEGIVEELVNETLGEEAALPLLQLTLQQLWKARERNRITWDAYHRIGGPRTALDRTPDTVYNGLIPEEQAAAKLILLRLVQPATGAEFTRNRVRRQTLRQLTASDRVDRVVDRFVAAGLFRLTPGETSEDDRIEVSHEALIRNWGTLGGWLDQERERLKKRLALRGTAELWLSHEKDPGGLLGGTLLTEAKAYVDLDSLEQEFVTASQTAQDAAERERQGIRQREVEQLRHLAEQKQQLVEQKQKLVSTLERNKRFWRLAAAVVFVLLMLVAVLAALVGKLYVNLREAQNKERETTFNLFKEQVEKPFSPPRHGEWLWEPGRTLRVKFIDDPSPPKELRERILAKAQEWTEHASIHFVESDDAKAELRVSLKGTHRGSGIGTEAVDMDHREATIGLGGLNERTPEDEFSAEVLCRFGNALGLINENNNPKNNIPWNLQGIFDRVKGNIGELEDMEERVGKFREVDFKWYRDFDRSSVMLLPISGHDTGGQFEEGYHPRLSESDITFISKLYPRPKEIVMEAHDGRAESKGEIKAFQCDRLVFPPMNRGSYDIHFQNHIGSLQASIFPRGANALIAPYTLAPLSPLKGGSARLDLGPGPCVVLVSSEAIGGEGRYSLTISPAK